MKPQLRMLTRLLATMFLGWLALILTGCGSSNKTSTPSTPTTPAAVGFLYTTTNGQGDNKVLRLSRYADGKVGAEKSYDTFGDGGANVMAGGDAHGDFDSQGAIQIIGNYLLTVNAGSNTISVFGLNRTNGELNFLENEASGGVRPVSIAYTKQNGSDNMYWVVVGNQWNNPNVQKGPGSEPAANIERYPNDGFFKVSPPAAEGKDLSTADASDAQRNITLFSFNSATGDLSVVKILANYPRQNGGPTTVSFSDDGSKLAVATWGIAHFGTNTPVATDNKDTTEQRPSRVYVYNFNNQNGETTNAQYFEQVGIAGTIGINWARGNNDYIHASNFNLANNMSNNGLTVLQSTATAVTKQNGYKTGAANTIDEACWTILSPDGKRLYVSSFGTNVITPFELNDNGTVKSTLTFAERGSSAERPAGDTKDMYITSDNKYLYSIGAFETFTMNRFNITPTGLTFVDQYDYQATKSMKGTRGANNFLGLAGFDIAK
ncbi:MAG: hypothetical protein ACPGUD_06545 [Parashewanella sp.]